MKLYLDTSALVKLYYPEPHSEWLESRVKEWNFPLLFSPLHELELSNAFFLKVFWKHLNKKASGEILNHVKKDIESGVLIRPLLNWNSVYKQALDLGSRYTPSVGCRSLDLLHIATALVAQNTLFVTFDEKQGRVAKKAGLKVEGISSF